MQFVLDDDGLATPDGLIDPARIRVAKLERSRVREHYASSTSTSAAGVVGGATAGAIIAGPIGLVAGGLLGSTIKDEQSKAEVLRTVSATMQIATDSTSRTVDVPLDRIGDAEDFVAAVRKAAGLE
jgi:uncharacterized protein YcfJ